MPDCDAAADERRLVSVAMYYGGVLNVAAISNLDALIVSPQHRVEPNAGTIAQVYIANQLCARGHVKVICPGNQPFAFEFKNHTIPPLRWTAALPACITPPATSPALASAGSSAPIGFNARAPDPSMCSRR